MTIIVLADGPSLVRVTWASTPDNLSLGVANNKGVDQPVHLHRLISAFVIRLPKSIISVLASREISIF